MSFYTRYELQRLIADGEAKTFRAVETATGRAVLLHMFNAGGLGLLAVLRTTWMPGGRPIAPLIEIGEFAGSQYAVTEAIEPFTSLRDLVGQPGGMEPAHVADPPPLPPIPPASTQEVQAAPSLNPDTGEFTRMFAADSAAKETSIPPAHQRLNPDTGEFTRMFAEEERNSGAEFSPPSRANPPSLLDDASGEFNQGFQPPSAAGSAVPDSAEMGDFTRAFGPALPEEKPGPATRPRPLPVPSPAPPAPRLPDVPRIPSPPPDWSKSGDTGEFTKLFGSGLPGEAIDIASEQARAAQSAAPESKPFQQAGEFTRMFGPELGGEAPSKSKTPKTPKTLSLNTSVPDLFDSQVVTGDPFKSPDITGDLSEYSKVVGEPYQPSPTESKKPAAAPPPGNRPGMKPGVVIAIVAGVVVVLVVILAAVLLTSHY